MLNRLSHFSTPWCYFLIKFIFKVISDCNEENQPVNKYKESAPLPSIFFHNILCVISFKISTLPTVILNYLVLYTTFIKVCFLNIPLFSYFSKWADISAFSIHTLSINIWIKSIFNLCLDFYLFMLPLYYFLFSFLTFDHLEMFCIHWPHLIPIHFLITVFYNIASS